MRNHSSNFPVHGQLTYKVQNGASIARTFDALARPAGYRLMQNGGASPPGEPFAVTYAYDALGHLASVAASSAGSFNFQPSTFNYTRLPGTDLVSGYTCGDFSRTVAYEPHRDLVSAVTNTFRPASDPTFNLQLSTFNYLNDAAGRRVEVTRSGAAFGPLAGATDAYGYNARSEVVSARRAIGGNEILGFGYDYAYDPIGNRLSATEYAESGDALVSSYSANALNQYTQRTVPGTAQVRGFADADAEVTVNGNGTWRSGEYFYGGDDADNAAFPVCKELAIEALLPAPTPDDYDEVTAVTGRVFVAQSPERFTYDADGNMLTDGRFRYTWNAENRLVRAQELVAPTNRHPYTVTYAYDHRGRMVSKRITENDGSDTLVKSIGYLWDDWNIIRESQTAGTLATSHYPLVTDYVWGLDIDGTLQGAGGVGGLLAVVRDGETYLPTYDANGNISEYVTTNGSIVAHYDYSPFGETLIESGDLASTFTHRFSTKPWCPVTGLCEYQMRKYRPGIGRWLSRDPIGMGGGINLYGFVGNQPLSRRDKRGLSWWNCCDECSPLGKKRLRGVNFFLRAGTKSDISPNVDDAANNILRQLQIAGLIVTAGEVASAGNLAERILALTSSAIDQGRTMGFEDAALAGIDVVRHQLLLNEGAVVWIRLDWDECKNSTCILLLRRYKNWISDHKWKKCARGGTHALGGFDLNVHGELGKGVKDCIHDAVKEFVDENF